MLYFTKFLANYGLIPSCSAVLGCPRDNNKTPPFTVYILSKTVISFVRLVAYHLYKTDQMLVHERMIVRKQLAEQ